MSTTLAIVYLVAFFGPLGKTADAPRTATRVDAAADKASKTLPSSVRIVRERDAGTLGVSGRDYRVRCRIASESLAFSTPQITVRDGERTTISDLAKRSFVVGHKTHDNARLPVSRDASEGTTFELTVLGVDGDRVVVDVAVELQSASNKDGNEERSVQVRSLKGRFIATAKLGASVKAEFGDWSAEVEIESAE